MVELNNPAARVRYWLERAEEHGTSHNLPAMNVWCSVWGLDPDDRGDQAECFRRGIAMIESGFKTQAIAEKLSEDDAMATVGLEYFHEIENTLQFFTTLGSSNWGSFNQHMSDKGWYSLRILSTLLDQKQPETSMNDAEQESLIDQTRRLVDAVLNSLDLAAEDKSQIVDSLQRVESALIRLQIAGSQELEHAVDGMIGNLFRVIMRRGHSFVDHPVTKGVLVLANAVSVALGMGADYAQIATSIGLALPSADGDD